MPHVQALLFYLSSNEVLPIIINKLKCNTKHKWINRGFMFHAVLVILELELGLIQTQMARKQVLRAY